MKKLSSGRTISQRRLPTWSLPKPLSCTSQRRDGGKDGSCKILLCHASQAAERCWSPCPVSILPPRDVAAIPLRASLLTRRTCYVPQLVTARSRRRGPALSLFTSCLKCSRYHVRQGCGSGTRDNRMVLLHIVRRRDSLLLCVALHQPHPSHGPPGFWWRLT